MLKKIDVYNAEHCPLSLICDEVYQLNDLNLFTVGTGECVYYTHKQPFLFPRHNWGFTLTDKELALGDLSEIKEALIEISCNNLHTICVVTCIPSLVAMDFSCFDLKNITFISAPAYISKKPIEIISDFYVQLLKDKERAIVDETSIWHNAVSSYIELCNCLRAKRHIVQDRKYLELLYSLNSAKDMEIIEDFEEDCHAAT